MQSTSGCDIETQAEQSSFIECDLSSVPNPYITDLQFRFRTRQMKGELTRRKGKNIRDYCLRNQGLSFKIPLPFESDTLNDEIRVNTVLQGTLYCYICISLSIYITKAYVDVVRTLNISNWFQTNSCTPGW